MPDWWNIPVDPAVLKTYNLTSHQWTLLCHVLLILCALSFALSTFTFLSTLLFKHKFPSRLVTYFSLTVAINAATLLVLNATEGRVLTSHSGCLIQGVLDQFFACASILWWLCITLNLYVTFVKNKKIAQYEPHMHVFCWSCALITTIIPTASNQMTAVGLWCWIREWQWQFAFYYAIMGTCWLIGAIMWASIIMSIMRLIKRYHHTDRSAVSVQVIRQTAFVVWFLVIFLLMFTHRLYLALHDNPPFYWMLLHLVAMSSQGIIVFLIFGLRYEIFWFWRNFLFSCCRKPAYESLE